jgi:rSAM/selenodomain-associated transferase 2
MKPRFSIIIPVINEEGVINSTIEHLVALPGAVSLEIIVVDGDRSGKTIGVIRDGNVKTTVSEKGRGSQMNRGAAMSEGDIVVFLHADTRLPPEALALMEGALSDPACPAGAFDLAIASGRAAYRLIAKIASLRSRLTRIPYGDQAQFFRRACFQGMGGFANIPLMEDVEIMQRVKKQGGRITIIKRAVTTSPRRWEKEGVFRCTLRNWLLVSLYFSGVSPERLSRFYK